MASFFSSRSNSNQHETSVSTWAYCFLFAREKVVAQCSNSSLSEIEVPEELVYFLKLLVSHYMKEIAQNKSQIKTTHVTMIEPSTSTLPKNIASNSNSSISTLNNNNDTSSTSSQSFMSYNSAMNPSHHLSSSLAYYNTSSSSPFKIKEKSTSSVTVVSSDSSTSYWCSPLSGKSIIHKSDTTLDTRPPSNAISLNPSYSHNIQTSLFDIFNNDNQDYLLSGSVPSEPNMFPSFEKKNNTNSAPSSPVLRSRSDSFSSQTKKADTLKRLLTNLMNGEPSYLDQTDDVKLIRRWIKLNGQVFLANLILIHLHEGLCSVIVCKDDPEKLYKTNSLRPPWKPLSSQVKQFKSTLKSYLSDFHSFLLTKEATHFTNLSFAVTYPGLIHFIYLKNGIIITPLLVDLNELDKYHELLYHIIYENKMTILSSEQKKWTWPSIFRLKQLCTEMIHLSANCRETKKDRCIQESKDNEYHLLYQRGSKNQELLSIYFNMNPPDRLWNMNHKLLNDLCQQNLN
ncbi:hypothetical protein RO3G_12598 [Rhizopus delemar RA 99-880]|uniref:Uncharacterized protein n=3 Tax=Rhizopus TaxID=4842 RepID=I1CHF7_RHIO9|nr:hypothetical protein RO3G_12598 [Rhizopus delemar RA 99-880]KAG1524133.1 hypothetical protein G6F52_004444 [Rhizopus delemar]|eukprot:EIE87887.1 hypothetical protein RO3G_12598 [Rhizopus delemar RA 99-880]